MPIGGSDGVNRRYSAAMSGSTFSLRVADNHPGGKYQRAAQYNLKGGAPERRFHVAVLNESDGPEFDENHGDCQCGGGPEMGDEIRQRVAEPADRRHDAR